MYCIRCGNQLEDGTKYCIFCGAPTAAVKKERPRPAADDDVSIPEDFFSIRMAPEQAMEETVRADEQPDEIEDIEYTRAIARDDIRAAIEAQAAQGEQPDEAGDADFTRAIAREDIRAAMREASAAEQAPAAEDVPETDIPDIPIPTDFIEEEEVVPAGEPEDGEPEQLISRRGLLAVVLVVVLLFAIAVGACVVALRGDTVPVNDTGSAAPEVGFWSDTEGE
ncbi:MAG TPA: zinc-ribbon domain-containing protein [Candidatus Butyricicoccus stercorigallinarum]|nr:zinc-ribbon domain-containing protein [Candidatus Butyricicoccus stercorigallinarum]